MAAVLGPATAEAWGRGEGPGAIDGSGGGCCDGVYRVGGGITAPTIVYKVDPEYSEEARKARYQGTVVLEAVVRRDGTLDVVHLLRRLGFGLDQKVVQAVTQWRFRPGTMNGKAVDTIVNIEVRFNLL
jgi:TonB family protein